MSYYQGVDRNGVISFKTTSGTIPGKFWNQLIKLEDLDEAIEALEDDDTMNPSDAVNLAVFGDVRVHCDDPSFLYWGWQYISWEMDYGIEREDRFPQIRNPRLKGTLCFGKGTRVLMADGSYKPIESIEPGESVFTHDGSVKKVKARGSRLTSDYYRVEVEGLNTSIITTPEHPFCVLDRSAGDNNSDFINWVNVEDLSVGQELLAPTIKFSVDRDISQAVAWLLGIYVFSTQVFYDEIKKSLSFTFRCGDLEEGLFKKYLEELGFKNYRFESLGEHYVLYIFDEGVIEEFFKVKNQGRREVSDVVEFPIDIFHSSIKSKYSFLAGCFVARGQLIDDKYLRFFTYSERIILGISALLQSMGIYHNKFFGSLRGLNMSRIYIDYRDIDVFAEHFKFLMDLKGFNIIDYNDSGESKYYKDYLVSKVTRVEKFDFAIAVFNLEIEDNESYLVEGLAVHNCKHLYSVLDVFPFHISTITGDLINKGIF